MNISHVPRKLTVCSFALTICFHNTFSFGGNESLQAKQQALDIISMFADRFCKEISFGGSGNNIELSGNAKAELNGVIKRLADIGIDGAAKYQKSEYLGLLQKDLLEGYKSNTDCRLHVWDDLNHKFFGAGGAGSTGGATQHSSGDKSPNISNTDGNVQITY
jgi:hypothetical protein